MVIPVQGQTAGDGGDTSDTTYCFAPDNRELRLTDSQGNALDISDVSALYGTVGGMTIYDDGVDVCSAGYDGPGGPKAPVGMSLSAASGWPDVAVPAGQVGIDPVLGRFAFGAGSDPTIVGGWDVSNNAQLGVFVQGDYAYIADWMRGLDVVRISDPHNPVHVARRAPIGNGIDVIVEGNYAYVTMKRGGLHVFDVSDPTNPIAIGSIKAESDKEDLALHLHKWGNLVYVADEAFGVMIYNVVNPAAPFVYGNIPVSYAEAVWVSGDGNTAYVAAGSIGLHIYDVTDRSSPVRLSMLPPIRFVYDVQVVGNYAYITEGGDGLRVVDVSDPSNPRHVSMTPTIGQAYDIRVVNGYAYVAERGTPGYIQIFDLSNPEQPVLVKTYQSAEPVNGLYVHEGHVYAAGEALGLLVVDPNMRGAPEGLVTVDYYWDDPSITPTPTTVPTPTMTPDPDKTMALTVQVTLQGRGSAPSGRWQTGLELRLLDPANGTTRYSYQATSNDAGEAAFVGVQQGLYDLHLRNGSSLTNMRRNVTLGAGTLDVDMGTLIEGDGNRDEVINSLDFARLAAHYGSSQGEANYDAQEDYNGDGTVNALDFALLAANYGSTGPIELTDAP
jgi:hypothetical protein